VSIPPRLSDLCSLRETTRDGRRGKLVTNQPESPGAAARSASIRVDGRLVPVLEGQSLAGALHGGGIRVWRRNPVTNEWRAPYCGMGVCYECVLTVDGRPHVRACLVHVVAGMTVTTELGLETHDVNDA